ncbi:calcium-binding protein, partial [Pseudovibrio sp. WM33]|uniref:calcium-binding protein n=1 Tax=Pseudovibrio sp. WM33 TaxID=1735585 RepID=UPI001AD8F303
MSGADIRHRLVSDMKSGGIVIGTGKDEVFSHALGDGSYAITSRSDSNNPDTLSFSDVNAIELVLRRIYNDVVITLPNGETITLINQLQSKTSSAVEFFEFADGTTWSEEQFRNRLLADMKATGLVEGTIRNDTLYHAKGDGSYSIINTNSSNGSDRLIMTGITTDDVMLSRNEYDVVIQIDNGEEVTLKNFLNKSTSFGVSFFEFADGTVWQKSDLRQQLIEDMKSSGTVIGTEFDDRYEHKDGDGPYTITETKNTSQNDRLVFKDTNRDGIKVQREGDDVIFTLDNGDEIKIIDQLKYDSRQLIETIEFSDGEVWDRKGLLSAIAEDMKASGAVEGSRWAETFRHSLGDGSYSIEGEQNLNGYIDNLVFTDVNSTEVTVINVDGNAVISLPNGESVTLVGYFQASSDWKIATVSFADDVVYEDLGLLKPIDDGAIKGTPDNNTIYGTDDEDLIEGLGGDDVLEGGEGGDTYRYRLGDGNDVIYDHDYTSGVVDRLVLKDVNASDVQFASNSDEDLVISFSNGEQITVTDHFLENRSRSVEEIEFADGTVLNLEAIQSKSVADQKTNGTGTI